MTKDTAIRPMRLSDFAGQENLKSNLRTFIDSSKTRGHKMDHILFFGPPGLGKTTLSKIMANELNVPFQEVMGPTISKPSDLAAILTNMKPNTVLFIDEIHRLSMQVEEILYPAMEDGVLNIMLGSGSNAKPVQIDLVPFTLVGATTRQGMLSKPLRDRFGINMRLEYYTTPELEMVVTRAAKVMGLQITSGAANEIAMRSRGTPRIALNLTRRVWDFTVGIVSRDAANESLMKIGIDRFGLDEMDRKYLGVLKNVYNGGPVGIETLAAAMTESRDSLEDIVEPYLMNLGLLQRTSKGRQLTDTGMNYKGI